MSYRARAVLAAVGLVALGFALGVSTDRVWLAHRAPALGLAPTHEQALVAMLGSLDLTDEQHEAIDSVLQRSHAKVERHLEAVHPILFAAMDSARLEIEAVLNPEQLAAFRDWLRAEHQRLDRAQRSVLHH